jgi:translation initiation factor IF-2
VHELAKEFGTNSKDLLEKLSTLGIQAKNHMSALEPDAVAKVRAAMPGTPGPAVAAEAPKPVAPTPAAVQPAPPSAPPRAPEVAAVPAPAQPVAPAAPEPAVNDKLIILKGPIVVRELAGVLGVRPNQLIAELMRLNVLASISESIEIKDAARVAEKHGYTVEREKKPEHKPLPIKKETKEAEVAKERAIVELLRPPVVTVLGHVDHGKTSLLDCIRNTSVAKGEAGGITQHIGASTVGQGKKRITLLDTPGHEAFTAMRARGATMTDIAIIVVDAQDGIMPQTQEAIKHAQAAKVPIMVALNKIDLPGANPDRVKQQLAATGLTPEDWGGSTICCPVSALTGQGVPELIDMILLQAEVLELKANPGKPATGFVIESQLESGMGPTANLLVSNGTLNVGDTILCGPHCGRVRALIDDHGKKLQSAGPATPVKCLGLPGVPDAGAAFEVVANDKTGRAIAEERQASAKIANASTPRRASLANIFDKLKENDQVELNLIIKTDVQGSLEAIAHSLKQIKSDKVSVNIIMSGVGGINANDILLASASNAVVIGFHVSVDEGASRLSKKEGVEIRLHSIIYELIDQVRDGMTGLLTPLLREKVIGHAEIKQVFTISKGSVIAGCMCTDGRISSRCKARVKRAGSVLFEGVVNSLRRFQNDVNEVKESQECGIRLENYSAYAEGDILEFFEVERIAQTL